MSLVEGGWATGGSVCRLVCVRFFFLGFLRRALALLFRARPPASSRGAYARAGRASGVSCSAAPADCVAASLCALLAPVLRAFFFAAH